MWYIYIVSQNYVRRAVAKAKDSQPRGCGFESHHHLLERKASIGYGKKDRQPKKHAHINLFKTQPLG